LTIYREAARTDPSITAALDAMMRAWQHEIAELLASVESNLRPGLSVADALAITLALCLDAGYVTLRAAGWDGVRYEQWLGRRWSVSCCAAVAESTVVGVRTGNPPAATTPVNLLRC
jgi:hypothetical protein